MKKSPELRDNMPDPNSHPQAAIGFTAIYNGSPQALANSQAALQRTLAHFNDLHHSTLEIGQTRLTLWGRGDLAKCCHTLPDGSLLALIGSPVGKVSWQEIARQVMDASPARPFILPWEGRVNLLRIDPHDNSWTLWNDWVGSIPVFHASLSGSRMASTLEPAMVAALGLGENDISLPSLLALLIWGHYFSDWTLFKNMKTLPPDCEARWQANNFQFTPRLSVQPSEQRWQAGWDEILEAMYSLSQQAIATTLKTQPHWVLPLSSGLDSRLIAGVAADVGADVTAYTWGVPKSSDVIHAQGIARALGIPWKTINPGNGYLARDLPRWTDLFGSAMHFHGMYQIPFLDALENEPPGPIISGFIGECMTGYDVKFLMEAYQGPTPYQLTPDAYLHWTPKELRSLMSIPIDDALDELAAEYQRLADAIPGPPFQKVRLLTVWGRQRHFTYFQSLMSDYFRGVATPYIHREYARFAYSIPRALLDERIMQQMMFARYYPGLAAIPGTYAREPITYNGSYLLKKRLARYLPEKTARQVFPGLYRSRAVSDVACVTHDGKASFQPLFEKLPQVAAWMNLERIHATYDNILAKNDSQSIRKLQSIQTFAWRLNTP
jgi:hypothetical protein